MSDGCNALIGQGAGIIYDLDIFLQNLGYLPEKNVETTKIKNISLDKSEKLVYGLSWFPQPDILTIYRRNRFGSDYSTA